MKKYIFSTLCILILSSCGSSSLTKTESSQGFSISHPSAYSVAPDTGNGIALRDQKSGTIIVAKKFAITQEYQKSNTSITEWYKKNASLDSNGGLTIGGKDGGYVQWTNKIGSLSSIHKDAWAIDGDSFYTLACTIPEKAKDSGMKDCDTVINSFSIK